MKIPALFIILSVCQIAYSQTLLSGFSRVQVGTTITSPTVMAFAPDGRIFVAQQSGALRVIKDNALLTTPFVTLSSVSASGERGLIGIALDPDFTTNHYVYLYYTTSVAPIHNRIVRYTATGDVAVPGSEQSILELDNLSGATNHNGGALAFGTDGKLYVAVGDNANSTYPQNLDTYHGKMLRINKDGSAPTDNPFYSPTASEQRKRIWSYGLRNPYTFSIQPGTGKIFVNDVGQNAVEEINDATQGGLNFGWPTAEGNSTNPNFTNPVFSYNHSGAAPTGCAITGGTFFNPQFTTYPASYVGKYFFQDYCSNWIYSLDFSGTPTATLFGSNVGGSSVALATGPDGNLYYLSRGSSALYKITSTNSTVPVITQQPAPITVSFGNPASFTVAVSGTAPLQYQWQKDEVNISGATASTFQIDATQLTDEGSYRVRITNIAGEVISNPAQLTVVPNTKPEANIISPAEGTTYTAGTALSFSGTGTDLEDGNLPPAALSWQINFHHDDHKHDEPPRTGINQGTFTIPDEGETSANVWYRFILTVTDSKGGIGKDSVDVLPKKSTLNFVTKPAGLEVLLDGQPHETPFTIESVEGMERQIGVESEQTLQNKNYVFSGWQHGGSQSQVITTPVEDITYTAHFEIVLGIEPHADVFPNPVNSTLILEGSVEHIQIHDYLGRVCAIEVVSDAQQTQLDLSKLPNGFYILQYELNSIRFLNKILVVH